GPHPSGQLVRREREARRQAGPQGAQLRRQAVAQEAVGFVGRAVGAFSAAVAACSDAAFGGQGGALTTLRLRRASSRGSSAPFPAIAVAVCTGLVGRSALSPAAIAVCTEAMSAANAMRRRSEEHTSELQSRENLV